MQRAIGQEIYALHICDGGAHREDQPARGGETMIDSLGVLMGVPWTIEQADETDAEGFPVGLIKWNR